MIIQTAAPHQPHLVIHQSDHARLSGQFAQAFGNAEFAPLLPADLMVFVAAHHDEGWQQTDAAALQDPQTGLPYHLTQTPLTELVKTSARSPSFNAHHHPYCGLLSSMHSYGLFHGRYGLSDKIFINFIPPEHKPAVQAMLEGELARQAQLKEQLAHNAETAVWIQEDQLFQNYKRLQFFDTLALYFHMIHADARTQAQFLHVPRQPGDDATITIQPVGPAVYHLAPYPFSASEMTFSFHGRLLSPQPSGTDLGALLAQTAVVEETFTLVA